MWYRVGSVSLVNGSAVVQGNGTDFVANTTAGDGFVGPDEKIYEVAQVVSAVQIILARNYQGQTAQNQGYALFPTQSNVRDLALNAANLLATFGAVRDGVGQGIFADGSVAAPGVRFAADLDTGLRRVASNQLALTTGGVDRLWLNGDGNIVTTGAMSVGTNNVLRTFNVAASLPAGEVSLGLQNNAATATDSHGCAIFATNTANSIRNYLRLVGSTIRFATIDIERGRFDMDGNLLVGILAASSHAIRKPVVEAAAVLTVDAPNENQAVTAIFQAVKFAGANSSPAALVLGRNSTNNRTINAGGTVNASGADYAEYIRKADGCGNIAKGDVCGINANGDLVKSWKDAVAFVVKSTDPSYVGGDVWSSHVGDRPVAPPAPNAEDYPFPDEPPAFAEPMPKRLQDEGEDHFADRVAAWDAARIAAGEAADAYRGAVEARAQAQAQLERDRGEYKSETLPRYLEDLEAFEVELEKARACVDRIAFSGQVPCNVTGDFAPGDYVIAVANGGGIKAVAVPAGEITFEQYRARLGKVWAVRDGRAWIDVQHG